MKYFIGFLTTILILANGSMAQRSPKDVAGSRPKPTDIQLDHDILVKNQRLEYIFSDVLHGSALRGGFVQTTGCSDSPTGRLLIKRGASIRQAMDTLVAANPGYKWDFRDGVVNLLPKDDTPLLHTKIKRFQMNASDREIPAILQAILRLPEVWEREASLGIKQGIGHGGGEAFEERPAPQHVKSIHIDVQNLSLQEAFNKILEASRDGVWIYRETDCNGVKTFNVELRSNN